MLKITTYGFLFTQLLLLAFSCGIPPLRKISSSFLNFLSAFLKVHDLALAPKLDKHTSANYHSVSNLSELSVH